MDSSEVQNSNLKFLLHCKLKWHNKANGRGVHIREGIAYQSVKLVLLASGNT